MSNHSDAEYGFLKMNGFLVVAISIFEGLAWSSFGATTAYKIGFAVWAVLLVLSRIHLARLQFIAKQKGELSIASKAGTVLNVIIFITAFSLFALYWEGHDLYKQYSIENSPQMQLAQNRVEQAQATLESLQANNPYSPEELASAGFEKSRLEGELSAVQAQAQANQQRQLSAIQSELDQFWNQTAFNMNSQSTGKTVRQLLGGSCTGSSYYHRKYCPQLTALKGKAPIMKTDHEKQLSAGLTGLSGVIAVATRVENAKRVLVEVEEALFKVQANSESAEHLPPAFHRASELFGAIGAEKITGVSVASVIGLMAIFALLMVQTLLAVGAQLTHQDDKEIVEKPTLFETVFEKVKDWFKQRMSERKTEQEPLEPKVEPMTVTATACAPLKEEGNGYDKTDIGFRTTNDANETNEKPKKVDNTKVCPQCGTSFIVKNYRHTYCCEECRLAAHGYTSKASVLASKNQHGYASWDVVVMLLIMMMVAVPTFVTWYVS